MSDVVELIVAIAAGDRPTAQKLMDANASLVAAGLARSDERFLVTQNVQIYQGDSALHAAGFSYDLELARELVNRGADVRARNRRGAEPLHAATTGSPRSIHWHPARQRKIIGYLVSAGADPDARAAGGVTPLHRAVRNRCSAAVEALLRAGADVDLTNDHGSTAWDLAQWTTGRGGTGVPEAKAEQALILDLLARSEPLEKRDPVT